MNLILKKNVENWSMRMACVSVGLYRSEGTAATTTDRRLDAAEDDEVLSVGCESPPPAQPSKSSSPVLKFSIDNILRPEFGGTTRSKPIDLTKEKEKNDSPPEMLWPAWVYCTRYSDRPSSGKSLINHIFILGLYIL